MANSVSECEFHDFRPFSVIAENHWAYVKLYLMVGRLDRNIQSLGTHVVALAEEIVTFSYPVATRLDSDIKNATTCILS